MVGWSARPAFVRRPLVKLVWPGCLTYTALPPATLGAPAALLASNTIVFIFERTGVHDKLPDTGVDAGDSEEFALDVSWGTIASKTKKRGSVALQSMQWRVKMVLFAICKEPLRRLHIYFMSVSSLSSRCKVGEWSALVDSLNERASLLMAVLQYLSTLLRAPRQCGRLILIARLRGCATIDEWLLLHPDDCLMFRNIALVIASGVHRRMWSYLQAQFGIFRLCDSRLGNPQRAEEARLFASRNLCCLPHGVARGFVKKAMRNLKRNAPSGSVITETELADALLFASFTLFLLSWLVRLSVFAVERMHRFNNVVSAAGKCTYQTLAAASLNCGFARKFNRWRDDIGYTISEQCAFPGSGGDSADDDNSNEGKLQRAYSVSEAFRKRYFRTQRENHGRKLNPSKAIAEVKQAWDEAQRNDPDEIMQCEILALSSRVSCAHDRRVVAAAAAAAIAAPDEQLVPLAGAAVGDDLQVSW